jgi:hypothetical protein
MALIKKIDVEKYFADRRAMRRGTIGLTRQPAVAPIKPTGRVARAPRSVNLSPEHSASTSSNSIPIARDSGRNNLLRPPGSWHE